MLKHHRIDISQYFNNFVEMEFNMIRSALIAAIFAFTLAACNKPAETPAAPAAETPAAAPAAPAAETPDAAPAAPAAK
ncbi:MAG: hypothetical protein B7Y56_04245 [Gallionellales bacterium 35-53-114]|nr:MAG: hypothetical protein B7Y56_04245 [Gallionellales bacterium 35-53-114]OZB08213.1 MAG: hypothetical protein B7X61_11855 [Gallionellales bacterium 39-52-133]HQS58141.1 hypothetical protein [Gallionellaceae bacterium]HQS73696.1 hypothetical protein [Gallionellaceae bacterium]